MSSFSATFDVSALDAIVDGMKDDVAQALRPAAQAGAQLLYNEVRKNVGLIGRKTGNLQRSIYQVYSKDQSRQGQTETYHISWNARKAPHGHLVEYGHVQRYTTILDHRTGKWITLKNKPLPAPKVVVARPFVRPAMAQFDRALQLAKDELFARLKHFK